MGGGALHLLLCHLKQVRVDTNTPHTVQCKHTHNTMVLNNKRFKTSIRYLKNYNMNRHWFIAVIQLAHCDVVEIILHANGHYTHKQPHTCMNARLHDCET